MSRLISVCELNLILKVQIRITKFRLNNTNKFRITETFFALKKKIPRFAKRKFSGL